jgi:signal peptidase I
LRRPGGGTYPEAGLCPGVGLTKSWESSRSLLLELLEIGLLAVGIYLVITFAIETVHVIGLSMYPTLDNDDLLIASKIDYHFHQPQRGDIVILKPPFGQNDLIKRVVGVPGDHLQIRDGHVYINGRQLEEPYINPAEPWTVNAFANEQTIPSGYFFVMGDNRNHSTDSRAFGPIRADDIEARAWLRIWPLNKFGFVDGHPTLETGLVPVRLLPRVA